MALRQRGFSTPKVLRGRARQVIAERARILNFTLVSEVDGATRKEIFPAPSARPLRVDVDVRGAIAVLGGRRPEDIDSLREARDEGLAETGWIRNVTPLMRYCRFAWSPRVQLAEDPARRLAPAGPPGSGRRVAEATTHVLAVKRHSAGFGEAVRASSRLPTAWSSRWAASCELRRLRERAGELNAAAAIASYELLFHENPESNAMRWRHQATDAASTCGRIRGGGAVRGCARRRRCAIAGGTPRAMRRSRR